MKSVEVVQLGKSFRICRSGDGPARSLVDEIARQARQLGHRLVGRSRTTEETFWALREVSFEVDAGSALGLIGSNGSGKSTLLKILSRITAPDCGHFRLRGRVSSMLEVGTGFHPELSARQNIFLNGAILGMRRREIARQLDEIVEFANVGRFLDEPVKHFSSGMYTRLAFSVAAFLDSEILLVDEVLAVGDAAFQEKCLLTMRHAASSGRTIVFVSHNMAAVAQLTQQTIVLDRGSVAFTGPTADAIGFYLERKRGEGFVGRRPTGQIRCQNHYRVDDSLHIVEMGLSPGQATEIAPGGAINMEFLIHSDRPRTDVRITYTVNSVMGQPLLSGHSRAFAVQSGRQLVELQIADLQLVPGDYQFSIYLGRGSWHAARSEHDMYIGFGRLAIAPHTSEGRPFGDWDRMWAPTYHTASKVLRIESQRE